MLVLDTQYCKDTGIYKLTDATGNVFTFENYTDAKAFIDYYFHAPVAALFGYMVLKGKGQAL